MIMCYLQPIGLFELLEDSRNLEKNMGVKINAQQMQINFKNGWLSLNKNISSHLKFSKDIISMFAVLDHQNVADLSSGKVNQNNMVIV